MSRYETCDWGWNDEQKRDELIHPQACYLLVRDTSNNKAVAFVHFRFDLDFDDAVLYW